MERKPSKANKMRSRLTFSRSSSARNRASTMVSPIASSPSSSRPRSATNPESPTHHEPMWDNNGLDPHRGYNFTDVTGYFRPASPFIQRQEVHEDLEADIKHACALLSHSIDRGIPAGLSYQSAVPNWTKEQRPAGQPSVEVPSSLEQHIMVISAAKPPDPETENNKKHDSGVGMSFSSPNPPGRPYGNSVSGTVSSARFYNKHSSSSPPGSPSEGSQRSRSPSLAESIRSDPRDLSITSTPIPFPYSPPQMNGDCSSDDTTLDSPVSPLNEADRHFQAIESQSKTKITTIETSIDPSPAVSSPEEPSLGEEGKEWLRASKDLQRLAEEEKEKAAKAKKAKSANRFYKGNNQTTEAFDSREWLAKNLWEERDPSIYGESSLASSLGMGSASRPGTGTSRLQSVSTSDEDSGYPYATWGASRGMSYSSTCLGDQFKHQEDAYSAAIPSAPPRNRRQKASLLLRKLAGLGMRRKEEREA